MFLFSLATMFARKILVKFKLRKLFKLIMRINQRSIHSSNRTPCPCICPFICSVSVGTFGFNIICIFFIFQPTIFVYVSFSHFRVWNKCGDSSSGWSSYHRELSNQGYQILTQIATMTEDIPAMMFDVIEHLYYFSYNWFIDHLIKMCFYCTFIYLVENVSNVSNMIYDLQRLVFGQWADRELFFNFF